MDRIVLANCVVLCAIILSCRVVYSLSNYELDLSERHNDKGEQKKEAQYLWFGPRLGRKKRSASNMGDEQFFRNSDQDREQLATFLEVMKDSPWAIVAVNEGKRHTVNFTPRLGRDSAEEFLTNIKSDRYLQDGELSADLLSQRSPPFAPRLGRRLSPYSPRLGRDSDKNNLLS